VSTAARIPPTDEPGESGSSDDDGVGRARRQVQPQQQPQGSKASAYEERRRQREVERERQEAAQEEEMRRAAAERAAREEAEAAQWMGQISVEGAGHEGADGGASGAGAVAQFVAYIRGRKMVPLEELAAEFGMRSQDAIARIQALEASGELTGLLDERGKYVSISRDEMEAVARFIRARGRVAIAELAQRSSDLIDLEPRAEAAAAAADIFGDGE